MARAPKATPKAAEPSQVVVSKHITISIQNGNASQLVTFRKGQTVTERHLIAELVKHEAVE